MQCEHYQPIPVEKKTQKLVEEKTFTEQKSKGPPLIQYKTINLKNIQYNTIK